MSTTLVSLTNPIQSHDYLKVIRLTHPTYGLTYSHRRLSTPYSYRWCVAFHNDH